MTVASVAVFDGTVMPTTWSVPGADSSGLRDIVSSAHAAVPTAAVSKAQSLMVAS
jgi:hypothetical protein